MRERRVTPAPTFSGMETSLALLFQQLRDNGFKRRQIAFDDVPDQGKIDAEILVREAVARISVRLLHRISSAA